MESLELVRRLASSRIRAFRTDDLEEHAAELGIPSEALRGRLYYLCREGWLQRIQRGLYVLSSDIFGSPLHEYELAIQLVKPAALSHWSAVQVHELTEQIPARVYVTTTPGGHIPRPAGDFRIWGCRFTFIQQKSERFFGFEPVWAGDSQVTVTDLERTVLDIVSRPKYCGDLAHVQRAVFEACNRGLRLDVLVDYALRLDVSTCMRVGWHLERWGHRDSPELERLRNHDVSGYIPLDPGGPRRGRCQARWNIQENVPADLLK